MRRTASRIAARHRADARARRSPPVCVEARRVSPRPGEVQLLRSTARQLPEATVRCREAGFSKPGRTATPPPPDFTPSVGLRGVEAPLSCSVEELTVGPSPRYKLRDTSAFFTEMQSTFIWPQKPPLGSRRSAGPGAGHGVVRNGQENLDLRARHWVQLDQGDRAPGRERRVGPRRLRPRS